MADGKVKEEKSKPFQMDDGQQIPGRLRSVEDFQLLMTRVRDVRRRLVHAMLRPHTEVPSLDFECELRSAERILSEGVDSEFRYQLNFDSAKSASGYGDYIEVQVEDELKELRKDLAYFEHVVKAPKRIDAFISELSQFHPIGEAKFREELAEAKTFLADALSEGKVSLITDWDGTMKTYSSQYTSCVQPAYSGTLIATFVQRYTKMAAVLTAAPLRNFGILDLTCLPKEAGVLFGGSSGREWLIDGKRIVEDAGVSDEARKALETLGDLIAELLEDEKSSLRPFLLVGSGFQRKVDRICLGMRTRSRNTVGDEKTAQYVAAITERLNSVDFAGRLFEFDFDGYDAEIVLKIDHTVWDKGLGVLFLLEQLGLTKPTGRVLICGDSLSDVPMVEKMVELGKQDETYVAMVDCKEDVKKKKLSALIDDKRRRLFVSCPEVLHAAMASLLIG